MRLSLAEFLHFTGNPNEINFPFPLLRHSKILVVPKRAISPMPVFSEVKQSLLFRVKLVFVNQIVITHPFETDHHMFSGFVKF